jgi:hypothetical protein
VFEERNEVAKLRKSIEERLKKAAETIAGKFI